MLRQLMRRFAAPAPAVPAGLVPAATLVRRFREHGGGPVLGRSLTRAQLAALTVLIGTEAGWARVCELVARAGDPWNAADWPEGFDPLMLCAALCDDVAFECARCPVGQRQGGSSCAHPQSLFGYMLVLIRRGDRAGLAAHLEDVGAVLDGAARWDLAALRRRDDGVG